MQERDKHAEGERQGKRERERKVHNWDIVPRVFPSFGICCKNCMQFDRLATTTTTTIATIAFETIVTGAFSKVMAVCVGEGKLNFGGVARGAFWGVIILMSLHKSHLHFSQLSN